MDIFIVTKEGAYRHDILGVFTTDPEKAKDHAKDMSDKSDGYHTYDVSKFELDKAYEEDPEEIICWFQNTDRRKGLKEKVIGRLFK